METLANLQREPENIKDLMTFSVNKINKWKGAMKAVLKGFKEKEGVELPITRFSFDQNRYLR